jgi:hypothetical protein
MSKRMIFPFSIKYKKQFHNSMSDFEKRKALSYIREFLIEKTGDNIVIQNNQLTFKAGLFGPRSNLNALSVIERGKFTLIETNKGTMLTYEFFMYQLIIIATAMSIFAGISLKDFKVGLFALIVLVGLNWLLALSRQKFMFEEIAKEIIK